MITVFVGGIHGSGKSTLCSQLAPMIAAEHITASDLIRDGLSSDPLRTDKDVPDVDRNQRLLLSALRKRAPDRALIDGHFALLTADGGVETISLSLFGALNLSALLLLDVDPGLAASRLANRDSHHHDVARLQHLRVAEAAHFALVANHLRLPSLTVTAGDTLASLARFLHDAVRP